MSEPKGTFDTDELVVFLEMNLYVPKSDAARAIIARLRAADALCAAAKDAKHELTFAPCRDNPERTSCLKCGTTEALRKAIANYEGKK